MNLTQAQKKFYRKLEKLTENSYEDSLTIREIAYHMHKCPSTVWAMLRRLEKKGYLVVERGATRGIRLKGGPDV